MIGKLKNTILIDLALLGYCLLLFCYVFYRALYVPFTFDEITTSQIAVSEVWNDFGQTANNHLLNTILIKGILIFFEPSEFIFRLPNVFAFILYLIYAHKIGKLITSSAPFITLVFLTSMPFVLDFFSLSRGYGLSLAFILTSIYFLLKYSITVKFKFALVSLNFGILAVLSNLSSINYLLPSLIVIILITLFSKEKVLFRICTICTISLVFLYYILPIVFQLKNRGELYFGGRNGFFTDTILSLSRTFAYHQLNISLSEIVISIIFLIAVLFSIINIFETFRSKKVDFKVILPILFFLCILSPVSQNILFETWYPTERTALLYYPIMILAFVNGWNRIFNVIEIMLLKLLAFFFIVHVIFIANLSHCYSWRFESGTREAINFLKEENKRKEKGTFTTVGIDYLFIPSFWFYKAEYGSLKEIEVIHCWEFDMSIEELDPQYYSNSINQKDKLSNEDAENIFSTRLDYYYLNDFVVDELIRHGYSVQVTKRFEIAGSSLIKLL